jgi:hypothetical protein
MAGPSTKYTAVFHRGFDGGVMEFLVFVDDPLYPRYFAVDAREHEGKLYLSEPYTEAVQDAVRKAWEAMRG